MKNKKGFTLIELAISFCIIAVISIMLFQIVVSIKDLYLQSNIKTSFLNKQSIMTKKIYEDFDNYYVNSMESCGLQCLSFDLTSKDDYSTKTTKLLLDPFNMVITYDGYSILYANDSYIGEIEVNYGNLSIDDQILQIHIPVYNKLVSGDYGLNIVVEYDETISISNELSITSPLAVLEVDDMTLDIDRKVRSESYTDINSVFHEATYFDGYYTLIFYHNIANGTNLFTNYEEVLKSTDANKYSALFLIDYPNLFKGEYEVGEDIDYYSFILYYPDSIYGTNGYNMWLQKNNFLKEDVIDNNSETTEITFNAYGFWNKGFNRISSKDTCGFISGHSGENPNCYFILGAKKGNEFNLATDLDDYTAQEEELWIRMDNYIDKYTLSKLVP